MCRIMKKAPEFIADAAETWLSLYDRIVKQVEKESRSNLKLKIVLKDTDYDNGKNVKCIVVHFNNHK